MTRRRRGWTLRLAGQTWRVMIPTKRVRFGREPVGSGGMSTSFGWVIVTRLGWKAQR